MMRGIARLLAVTIMLVTVAGAIPARAHRLPGTGGKVWVTDWRPDGNDLVVFGKIRQSNDSGEDLVMRCRIEVTTTEGRTGTAKRQLAVDDGHEVVKQWRLRVPDSAADASPSDIDVLHCHEA